MYRVALNTAITHSRIRSKTPGLDPLPSYHNPFSEPGQKNEDKLLLFEVISRLNNIDRAIILLWLEGEKYEEIAEVIGTTKSNVSVKLVRIKQEIKRFLNS
jgi:RNA polymerase sigma-70 factor (ECF subfamily)